MRRPDDEQEPRDGADQATAPPNWVPPPQQAGRRDAAPIRPDLWSRTVDLWFRTMARDQEFRCPDCGYDLHGLPAPGGFFRCPECGRAAARCRAMVRKDAMTWWDRWRHHFLVITLLAALLVLLVLLVPDDFIYEVAVSTVTLTILAYLAYFVQGLSNGYRQVPKRLPGLGYRESATSGSDRALSEALHAPPEGPQGSGDQAPEARTGDGSPMSIQHGHGAAPERATGATRDAAKRGLAAVMFILGCFVALAVMETRASPLLPTLKPLFGISFGMAFLAAQLSYVFLFRIRRGWIWLLAFCILRIPFFFLTSNTALWQNPEALSGLAELVTGAACISGFLLGLLVLARRL